MLPPSTNESLNPMSNDKPKIVKMNAPVAVAKWPKLTEPDYGTKEFPKPEGEYSVKLVWDEADAAFVRFKEKLQPYMDAAVAVGQAGFNTLSKPQRDKLGKLRTNELFTPIYDENDEPTGQVEMKLSMKASGVVKKGPREGKKWARSPDIYDARGQKIKTKIAIWGGSELIVSFSFTEGGYFIAGTGICGLKVQLEGIQIITLRMGGDRSAESHGFSKQDGFDGSEMQQEPEDQGSDDEFESKPSSHTKGDPTGSTDF